MQGLTLKYHTSKISEFSDLQTLSSFGFRGEALSSLCALADVSVTTRTKEEAVGARLSYDRSGTLTSQESVARAVGTTVAVAKLFAPLPVRYKEFHRNIRREYGRLLSILQVHCARLGLLACIIVIVIVVVIVIAKFVSMGLLNVA